MPLTFGVDSVAELTLFKAIDDLFRKARTEAKATSTKRLEILAQYCVQELATRGLAGAVLEPKIPGFAREKAWDVAWFHRDKVRLAISLKSLLTNLGGTVPNRIDDLMGEVANIQMYSPEVVIGYFMVFNVQEDHPGTRHGGSWAEVFGKRLEALSGRRPPHWTVGTVEASALVLVDFSDGPLVLTPETPVSAFFDTLVEQVLRRNPDLAGPDGKAR